MLNLFRKIHSSELKYQVKGKKLVISSKTKKRGVMKSVIFRTDSWKEAKKLSKKFGTQIIRVN